MLFLMTELRVEQIVFPNDNQALLLKAPAETEAAAVIRALELQKPRALLIINGGTAKLEEHVSQHLSELFEPLARTVIQDRITVITGATDA